MLLGLSSLRSDEKATELSNATLSQTVVTRHVLVFKCNCSLVIFPFSNEIFYDSILGVGEGFWRKLHHSKLVLDSGLPASVSPSFGEELRQILPSHQGSVGTVTVMDCQGWGQREGRGLAAQMPSICFYF